MSDTVQSEDPLKMVWQKVPQEERSAILTRAQGRAIELCTLLAVFSCAAAFGLHLPVIALFVAALLPVIYQVVVARAVLDIKPQTIARYFIASQTARQYAEALNSGDPTPKTLFRGVLQEIPEETNDRSRDLDEDYAEENYSSASNQKEVWISLFPDTLVMFSESNDGARLEFSSPTLHSFLMTLESPEDSSGRPLPQQLVITNGNPSETKNRWLVTSQHTSSLLACERKVRFYAQRAEARAKHKSRSKSRRGSHSAAHSLFASNQLGANLEAVSNPSLTHF